MDLPSNSPRVLPKYLFPLLVTSIVLAIIAIVLSAIALSRQSIEVTNSGPAEIVVEDDCSGSEPCSGDFTCVEGKCEAISECTEDSDCESGECYKGSCQEATEDTSTYTSEDLGVSFEYGSEWSITEDSSHGHFLLRANDEIFFSADSYPYEGPDRGAGWTDLPHEISGQEWVDDFCDKPTTYRNQELPADQIENCLIVTNKAGVSYAKALQEIQAEGGSQGWAYIYYFYNDASDTFPGIVLSSVFIDESEAFSGIATSSAFLNEYEGSEVEQFLDQIANSMKFSI